MLEIEICKCFVSHNCCNSLCQMHKTLYKNAHKFKKGKLIIKAYTKS